MALLVVIKKMIKNYALPQEFFDKKTLNQTYNFIDSLKNEEIVSFRKSYRRELNQSSEENVLPETTLTMRRCFLYLTTSKERITS